MKKATICIKVAEELAAAYAASTVEERRKIQIMLGFHLRDWIHGKTRPLREIMDEISQHAQARGLTPEILEEILKDEE